MAIVEGMASLDTKLQALIGEKLSSVTFVLDYWQLAFDGYGLTIMSRIAVTEDAQTLSSGEPTFRDRLCAQIGKVVFHIGFQEHRGVSIIFEDRSIVELSSRDEDYRGPEAILFYNRGAEIPCVV